MEFDSGHTDAVNDVQLDYYGRRVATASSDRTIGIFDVATEPPGLLATLSGHAGPVWQVAWAHPKFGSILASCSFDNTVIIWKGTESGWMQIYQSDASSHSASVNGVAWASHEAGLILASASSDGSVVVHECQPDGTWATEKVPSVDAVSCTSVSWAPVALSTAMSTGGDAKDSVKRFVVGGCENCMKIISMANGSWRVEKKLLGHTDWVLDVAWAPSTASGRHCIASAGQDGKVIVWKEKSPGTWEQQVVHEFALPVYRVRWSVTGNVLAVGDASQGISLWRQSQPSGKWTQVPE